MKLLVPLFFVAWICAIIFYLFSLERVHENCQGGHVVKNIFDWPVCVH